LCPFCPRAHRHIDFILLLHPTEIFKPTNTGRLIADVFPSNVYAFCWDRTRASDELLALLKDENRLCLLVFPVRGRPERVPRKLYEHMPKTSKKITCILLDGTWKQASRMFHLSRWLDTVACLQLPTQNVVRAYRLRLSHQENYLSTAEAAALCLEMAQELKNAAVLREYFSVFNMRYKSTSCRV